MWQKSNLFFSKERRHLKTISIIRPSLHPVKKEKKDGWRGVWRGISASGDEDSPPEDWGMWGRGCYLRIMRTFTSRAKGLVQRAQASEGLWSLQMTINRKYLHFSITIKIIIIDKDMTKANLCRFRSNLDLSQTQKKNVNTQTGVFSIKKENKK